MTTKDIKFIVNEKEITVNVQAGETLLEVLRDKLHLTGVKYGCNVGECGACTVLVDGEPIDSCIYLAIWADGKKVKTIEGIAQQDKLSTVQQAFLDETAVQCGFCIPGFVMSAEHMAESGHKYTREEIKRELSGHMCRCTGYNNIINAVEKVVGKK